MFFKSLCAIHTWWVTLSLPLLFPFLNTGTMSSLIYARIGRLNFKKLLLLLMCQLFQYPRKIPYFSCLRFPPFFTEFKNVRGRLELLPQQKWGRKKLKWTASWQGGLVNHQSAWLFSSATEEILALLGDLPKQADLFLFLWCVPLWWRKIAKLGTSKGKCPLESVECVKLTKMS